MRRRANPLRVGALSGSGRGCRQAILSAFLGLMSATSIGAQDLSPRVRTRLEPGSTVTVGQPVQVVVEVLVPSYFMGAPAFQDLDVDNSLVLFNDRGANFTERDGRLAWAGQRRSYTIYPQVAGEYVIEGISVRTAYFANGRTEATTTSGLIRFEAVIPDEAEGLGYFIATTRLRLQESYEPLPDTLRVGDAFTRTVTTTVDEALAMVIPPIPVDTIAGFALYPDPPRVDDQGGERGEGIVGTRVESTTYVAQATGAHTVPGLRLTWWDLGASRLREATLPERPIVVVPNPDSVAAIALLPDSITNPVQGQGLERLDLATVLRRFGPSVVLFAVALALLIRVAKRWLPRVAEWRARRRQTRAESEAVYFSQFKRAVGTRDDAAVANAFMEWLDRWSHGPGLASASDFVERAADSELEREAGAVGQALFGRPGADAHVAWSGPTLTRAVEAARRRGSRRPTGDPDQQVLPPLNP